MVQPEARTGFIHQAIRRGATEVLTRTKLPIEIHHNPETERRLHELVAQDFGIVEVTNHWGLMEFPSILEFNYRNKDLRGMDTLLPFADHQYKPWLGNVGKKLLATQLNRTATRDAEEYYMEPEHAAEKPADFDELNGVFIKDAAQTLKPGGAVLFSPQGKRQPELPERFPNRMMATFLAGIQAEDIDLDKIAFLFLGTGLKGVTDHEVWKDVKWTKPHPPVEIKVGEIITFPESPLPGRILGRADKWARSELAKIVPPVMLPYSPAK